MSNPHPVAGFDKRPHDINREGRPKKDWTWAGLIEEEVEKYDEADMTLPKAKRLKIKAKVVKRIIEKALAGDIQAFQVMANRTDGTPTEHKNLNIGITPVPILDDVKREVVAEITEDKKQQDVLTDDSNQQDLLAD